MKGDALANMLQDRRILVIIVAVIVIIATAAAYMVLKDDGKGGSDDPSDGLTIDNERTISEDMVIEGDLVITDKGKLTLADGAMISMLGPNAKIDVKGTLDATDGHVQFVSEDKDGNYTPIYENGANEARSVASTGTFTMNADDFYSSDFLGNVEGIIAFVNGAIYASGENVVLTTVAAAAAATADIDVFGTVNESSNITISGAEVLKIMEGANVTLGTVTIGATTSETADVVIDGKLTGSITASNIGAVKLAAANGITVDRVTTGTGTSPVTDLVLDGTLAGAVNVTSGTVDVGTLTVNGTGNTVTVDSGATLMLAEDAELTAGASADEKSASVVVAGNIIFDGGEVKAASATVDSFFSVSGVMTVLESTDLNGSVTLSGVLVIGEKPTDYNKVADNKTSINASVKIGADAYVKVYGNGTFSTNGATLVNTVFNINGNKYMTVYAQAGDVAIDTVLSEESFVNGTTAVPSASDSVNWNQKEDYLGEMVADNKNIGESGYETVNYQTSTVKVTFTLAADTTLSLDSKSITNGNVLTLVVGHEYTITTNGTVNGTGVSGTTFTPTTSSTTVSVTAAQPSNLSTQT